MTTTTTARRARAPRPLNPFTPTPEALRRVRRATDAFTFYREALGGFLALLSGGSGPGYATAFDHDGGGEWIDGPPAGLDYLPKVARPRRSCPLLVERIERDALDAVGLVALHTNTFAADAGIPAHVHHLAGELADVLDRAEAWDVLATVPGLMLAAAFFSARCTDAGGWEDLMEYAPQYAALTWDTLDALTRATEALPPLA